MGLARLDRVFVCETVLIIIISGSMCWWSLMLWTQLDVSFFPPLFSPSALGMFLIESYVVISGPLSKRGRLL